MFEPYGSRPHGPRRSASRRHHETGGGKRWDFVHSLSLTSILVFLETWRGGTSFQLLKLRMVFLFKRRDFFVVSPPFREGLQQPPILYPSCDVLVVLRVFSVPRVRFAAASSVGSCTCADTARSLAVPGF
jgi:hypothetical protein